MKQNWLWLTLTTLAVGCGGAPGTEESVSARETGPAGTAEQALNYCNPCPSSMTAFRGQNGFQLECSCASTATASGSVWGTDTYTDDSTLCRAAVHAGAIPSTGGAIVATMQPGLSSYVGSTRNGVTSSSYGSWSSSYSVSTGGSCIPPPPSCPGNLTTYRGQDGTLVSCLCSGTATASGTVWGTGTYTDDSALCRAALHAGVISSAGGTINAVVTGGLTSYTGTTSNGVTSLSYGSWPGSYVFQ